MKPQILFLIDVFKAINRFLYSSQKIVATSFLISFFLPDSII